MLSHQRARGCWVLAGIESADAKALPWAWKPVPSNNNTGFRQQREAFLTVALGRRCRLVTAYTTLATWRERQDGGRMPAVSGSSTFPPLPYDQAFVTRWQGLLHSNARAKRSETASALTRDVGYGGSHASSHKKTGHLLYCSACLLRFLFSPGRKSS